MKKNHTTLLLYLISYLMLTGFSFGKPTKDDLKYKGTSIGVNNCIKRSKQEEIEISSSFIKEKCIDKHEKELSTHPPSRVIVRYTPYVQFLEIYYTNLSEDKIITYFELLILHEDNISKDGEQIVEKHKVDNLMILPKRQKWRTIHIDQKYFKPKADRVKNFSYSIANVRGVDFVVD
jgi:hypothetical protein